jgi:hypothetical protein
MGNGHFSDINNLYTALSERATLKWKKKFQKVETKLIKNLQ